MSTVAERFAKCVVPSVQARTSRQRAGFEKVKRAEALRADLNAQIAAQAVTADVSEDLKTKLQKQIAKQVAAAFV